MSLQDVDISLNATLQYETDHGFNVVSARQDKLKPMALLLKVISAAGLRAGDTNGKSDPYCRIFVEQEGGEVAPVLETSTRWATLNPVWDEEFDVKDLHPGSVVRFETWDKDNIGSDDFLGEVTVTREKLWDDLHGLGKSSVELELALTSNPAKNSAAATGTLKVSFSKKEGEGKAKGRVWKQPSLEKAQILKSSSRFSKVLSLVA